MRNYREKAASRGVARQVARDVLSRSPLRRPLVAARNRQVRPNDIILASYPKSGNTWIRHMLTQIITGEPSAWRGRLHEVVPGVQHARGAQSFVPSGDRIFKTHEAYSTRYRRGVVVVRDSRDIVLSEYHYRRDYLSRADYQAVSFEDYVDRFVSGRTNPYGRWDEHVTGWLDAADTEPDRFLVVKYEDLKAAPVETLGAVLSFAGIATQGEAVREAVEFNDAERLRNREKSATTEASGGTFVRAAAAGGWRAELTAHQQQKLERMGGAVLERLGYPLEATS